MSQYSILPPPTATNCKQKKKITCLNLDLRSVQIYKKQKQKTWANIIGWQNQCVRGEEKKSMQSSTMVKLLSWYQVSTGKNPHCSGFITTLPCHNADAIFSFCASCWMSHRQRRWGCARRAWCARPRREELSRPSLGHLASGSNVRWCAGGVDGGGELIM